MDHLPVVVMLGIITYIMVGIIWTKFQLWRWPANIGDGDVFQHYPLELYPRWSISKGQKIFQSLLWLPVVLFQIVTLLSLFLAFGTILLLCCLSSAEEKITP